MKRLIIGAIATSLIAAATVFGYSKATQKEECKEGSACCYPGSACCKK